MCRFKGFAEVGDEGDGEVVELDFQALSLLIYHIDERETRGEVPGRAHSCPPWDSRWRDCSRIERDDVLRLDHRLHYYQVRRLRGYSCPSSMGGRGRLQPC